MPTKHMTQYVAPKCNLYCSLQGKVLAGPTNMTKYVAPKCTLYCFLQGKVLAWPTHMTHDVAPKCTLYCFLQGMVGGCYFWPWLAPGRLGEGVFINREQ